MARDVTARETGSETALRDRRSSFCPANATTATVPGAAASTVPPVPGTAVLITTPAADGLSVPAGESSRVPDRRDGSSGSSDPYLPDRLVVEVRDVN